MGVNPVPDRYHTVTPYLVCKGLPKLLDFLATAFDAVEVERALDGDGRVMHAETKIGDSIIMMGEAKEEFPPVMTSLYLYVPNTDATYKRALDAGATSIMEPADQFYGDRNAGVIDPSGNRWWIATHIEDVSPEELARRARERK
jgi:uncharacterized glyoxalase superfamily protein PhnB